MKPGFTLLAALLLASSASGDVLILKGGQRFEGEVVDKGKTYEVRIGTGTLVIAKSEVAKHVPSIEALTAEAEKLHAQARALYEEATKPEADSKASNEQLKKGVELLRKAADLYQEAREHYADEKQAQLDGASVKLLQEMRLYRDKMSSEIAKGIPPTTLLPEAKAKPPEPEAPPETKTVAPPAVPAKPARPDLLSLIAAAKTGDLDAMFGAGRLLDVEEWKATESEKWLRMAADKGHLRAQAHLGLLALEGRGRKPDLKEANAWLLKADAKGEPLAKVHLARMLFEGIGGSRSLRRADDLCERAAPALRSDVLAGDPDALRALGWMHLEGLGVPQNTERALQFLKGAAEQGDVRALLLLGTMYDTGRGVAQNRDEAAKTFKVAADKGYAPAQALYAEIHDQNFYRKDNPLFDRKLAREWFQKAAVQGHPLGQFWMGWMHIRAYEGPKDEKEGIRLWTDSLKTATGKLRLMILNDFGYCAERGMGMTKDMKEAARYWREAAELGHPMSQYNMGYYCENEQRNQLEAFKWHEAAARQNYPNATIKMGTYYREGKVVAKNLQESERWYAVAVQLNVANAEQKLREVQQERGAKR